MRGEAWLRSIPGGCNGLSHRSWQMPAQLMLAAVIDPSPYSDLGVLFRANREREVNGNQIIDWQMQIGQQPPIQYKPVEQKLRWRLGDPVRIVLRYAKDSPYVPVATSDSGYTVQDQRTVTFNDSNLSVLCLRCCKVTYHLGAALPTWQPSASPTFPPPTKGPLRVQVVVTRLSSSGLIFPRSPRSRKLLVRSYRFLPCRRWPRSLALRPSPLENDDEFASSTGVHQP